VTPGQLAASLADRYRIERELGAGGMATVYLAQDIRHDRQVALKVMKPEIVATVGADRFVQEIRTTAHLKHPHVLPLFDSGRVGDGLFYVMPYIEGESLRARLRRDSQLPVTETIAILREVADALAYAHAQGIVHRDIKPDNVLLSGRHVFLADFGIARALEVQATDQTVTGTSAIVGTPAYISPEQASGRREIDHRADIYAFGVMAYEMLAGQPPFTGDTAAMLMAAHITATPDRLSARRSDVPPALAELVMKCLAKRPENRWQRMDDVLAALDDVSTHLRDGTMTKERRRALRIGIAALIGASIAGGTAWVWWRGRVDPPPAIGRLTHVTRDPGLELDPAISPDGRTLAYVAGPPGRRRIYVRQIDGGRPIALTEAGVAMSQRRPDWSPDGSRIVFQAGQQGLGVRPETRTGALYIVPALGGAPMVLVSPRDGGVALTPAWSPDGSQVAYCSHDSIRLVPASGGPPRVLLKTSGTVHSPRWSPDGERLAYVAGATFFALGEEQLGNTETSAIHVVDVATGVDRKITSGDWLDFNPWWTADGRGLIFVSGRSGGRDVYRARLSPSGAMEGEPERVTSGLQAHSISFSRDRKLLAYSSLLFRANIWSIPIPDTRVASVAEARQVTFGSEKSEKLVVSRDGQWLAFDSDRSGYADVWKLRIAGGEPEQVTRDAANEFVNDWSPDGREILYQTSRSATGRDIMVVTLDGTRTATIASTPEDEQHGTWNPEGNSIAFVRGRSEQYRLFVTSRTNKDAAWASPRQLTSDLGIDPKWSHDGRRIAFTRRSQVWLISPDGANEHPLVTRSAAGGVRVQYAIWSPDDQTIYFKAFDDEQRAAIWAVPAKGGTPRLLVRFDDPSRPSLRREFASDGKQFFFTIAQDESDVWIAEVR
jgi:Tol biopolymer transport system component/tRNA A-37 threonylcarbamoyl transferase component Bud32